jgi:hypothetical protein
MNDLQLAAKRAIRKYGSARKASEATGVHFTLLSMLSTGKRQTASEVTGLRLGIKRRVSYERVAP